TGLADPVYVEGFLRVHSFDLVLELNVFNRTNTTLQNIQVELSTQGDLKIVERPQCVTLAPGAHAVVYATIKVSSTETGVIYGYVAYDMKSADDKESLVLNELHVDILDYIERAWVNELNFRTMWSEFEWENKINITNTNVEPRKFLANLMENTNMSIVGRREVRAGVKSGEDTHTAKKALVKAEVARE
ncbi:Coatomer subunit beta, partial [Perkinsus olseni]